MESHLELHNPFASIMNEDGSIAYEYVPANGQITFDSKFGQWIAKLASDPLYTTYFEVGTWKGNGTTRCLVEGIMDRYVKGHDITNLHFWSLESNIEYYKQASGFWLQAPIPFLHLLYGSLHKDRIITEEEIRQHPKFSSIEQHFNTWYAQDKEDNKHTPCLDMNFFPSLDVIILDGGEFSGYADWSTLQKKNPKVVCLDDIHVLKNYDVYNELKNSSEWLLLVEGSEQNGWAIFKKK